jgi:uroporphyrinogen decarboxylase
MKLRKTRRQFVGSIAALAAGSIARNGRAAASVSKRDLMFSILDPKARREQVPAAFFIHFDPSRHFGAPAVEKHLEYFRGTGMDFVKIQYERTFPLVPAIGKPGDWAKMPSYGLDFYEPQLEAVRGLVKAARKEALVLVTLYSAYMSAGHTVGLPQLTAHLEEDPEAVKKGLEVITGSLMRFVKECIRAGVDGFYASTQGGEAGRFRTPGIFEKYIKPFDLVLMNEINRSCAFNILHVCDYNGPYSDLTPYLDYPGHVVNCNPRLTTRTLGWQEVARMFKRPCMGGLDRHGLIVTGSRKAIEEEVRSVLAAAPRPFILGADCTLPGDISWDNIRAAIDTAHGMGVRR